MNNTEAPYPSDVCIHHLFEDRAKLSPDVIAMVHNDRSMTYRELNDYANSIACRLIAAGVRAGDHIAIILNRSIDFVAVQLAILRAGAAYVPIDPRSPIERQVYIVMDCAAKLVVTDQIMSIPDKIESPVLRLRGSATMEKSGITNDHMTVSSSMDTAYIMYTSGSTGQPKGVMVSHHGVTNLAFYNGYFAFTSDDCITFANNPSFDLSTFDVWNSLFNGACIVIIDREIMLDAHLLSAAIDHYNITSILMTTALFHQYAYIIGPTLSKLKYLICVGEQGSIEAFSTVAQYGGPVRIFNAYGPTETTVIVTAFEVTKSIKNIERLPIGRPLGNTRLYVLDKQLAPVPIGVAGELYVGGSGVANGYLNRPDLTEKSFVPDPFTNVDGARMYKTGDLVRYLPDGNLVFIGRRDNQIKIRGYRVELGEIEFRLVEHPDVREAIVIACGEGGNKRLVGYVVCDPRDDLDHGLREYLSMQLPEYMVPSAFVQLDSMPLTNNGKVDRRALPHPNSASFATGTFETPKGDIEVALADIWSGFLVINHVGRHDNFFTLGGHSLMATRMINIVRASLGVHLNLHSLFLTPTIAGLARAALLRDVSDDHHDEFGVLLPLKRNGNRTPLFCIHPGLGSSWSYRGLAQYLHLEQPLYGLQARGLDGKTPLASSIEEMTLDYIDQIQKVQPHGPYNLLGWSFGGIVAYNIAVELERRGEKVQLLAILDSLAEYQEVTGGDLEEEKRVVEQEISEFLPVGMGPDDLLDIEDIRSRIMAVVDNNRRLLKSHNTSVVNVDILFLHAAITADNKIQLIDPAAWKPLTRGKVEVHEIQCLHNDMAEPEHIAVIGRIISSRLDKLQETIHLFRSIEF
ncbi:hypothetical protein BGW42_003753 [Actinomortierella wolfii]|nr:hypothetical protein BGW42_003753 [Actinomortierella wolfii]